MNRWFIRTAAVAIASALMVGCTVTDDDDAERVEGTAGRVDTEQVRTQPTAGQTQGDTMQATGQTQQSAPDMRLEVNLAERELYVYRGGERVATHPVAVGSEEWPTPTGEWTIGQVVWNPRWIPPEEEWAEDEEVAEPGDPDNPLGRAQLVYDPPNTIHGTNDPSSLGKAVSHGSIRVSNEVAMDLARQVMEAGGAGKSESWYREVRNNPSDRRAVAIPDPVPIRVVSGSGG